MAPCSLHAVRVLRNISDEPNGIAPLGCARRGEIETSRQALSDLWQEIQAQTSRFAPSHRILSSRSHLSSSWLLLSNKISFDNPKLLRLHALADLALCMVMQSQLSGCFYYRQKF